MPTSSTPPSLDIFPRSADNRVRASSHDERQHDERGQAFAERVFPIPAINEDRATHEYGHLHGQAALYARAASDLFTLHMQRNRECQYSLYAQAIHAVGGRVTASFFNPALAARAELAALVVANAARSDSGTNALAQAGPPVLLADLHTVIPPGGWDGLLPQVLTSLGGGR